MSRSDAVSVPLLTTSALYCALAIPRGIIPPLKRHRPDACDEAFFCVYKFVKMRLQYVKVLGWLGLESVVVRFHPYNVYTLRGIASPRMQVACRLDFVDEVIVSLYDLVGAKIPGNEFFGEASSSYWSPYPHFVANVISRVKSSSVVAVGIDAVLVAYSVSC